MPAAGSYSYAVGPLVALLGVGALVLLLRWAFSRGHSLVPPEAHAGRSWEYGLLVTVAAPASDAEADAACRALEAAGVRATLASTLDGPRIMVWPEDAGRAHAVLHPG